MAIAETVVVQQSALWPQGDARDPLGVWGFRHTTTGDATAGSTKVTAQIPADRAQAYVYTCYSVLVAQLTVDATEFEIKCRLLTNWPNIDPQPGVQAYSTGIVVALATDADFTPPISAPIRALIQPNDRFLLLFNFQGRTTPLDIVELEMGGNVDTATVSWEGYGYFWDRSVLNAPGGPRHPGSS